MKKPLWLRRLCRRFIFWGPWIFLIYYTAPDLIPTSHWFTVRTVVVSDTRVGVSPAMLIDRTIERPFFAWWTVTVRKVVMRDGGLAYVPACLASGQGIYNPRARVPADADLDWWTQPTKCNLSAGQYVVSTQWTLDVAGLKNRTIIKDSNTFRVE